jgi:hypothetical protein
MRNLGLEPDPWQIDVLEGNYERLLLNCCRQAGKSTVVAMLALVEAVWEPGTKILLVSRTHRQSMELLRIVHYFFGKMKAPLLKRQTTEELELDNESRIVSLPCREETIRGHSNIRLLIIDESARVPDDLYRAVRPMLAVSNGRMICLSTPYGKRGFFYDCWARGGEDWKRIEVPAERISRISPEFLAKERRAMGESWYRQEYCCSFEALEGLVYPDFGRCVVEELPAHVAGMVDPLTPGRSPPLGRGGRRFGGIDFGLRNPFAAVWGTLDRDGILWLTGEHYSREKPLAYHAKHLPRDVTWYGDPAGAREIMELRCAGVTIRNGDNHEVGFMAVRSRLENGTLKVLKGACPNLLAEAGLYRYDPEAKGSEKPVGEYDHALDALRYLICKLDRNKMARIKKGEPASGEDLPDHPAPEVPESPKKKWLSVWNEELWTRISP